MDAHGLLIRIRVTEGVRADCKEACDLIDGISASPLFADKAYDVDSIIDQAMKQGMTIVMPPKKNRKEHRVHDKYLYKFRYLVENAFLNLKRWRGIATRYAKNNPSFLAAVQIRCIDLWVE